MKRNRIALEQTNLSIAGEQGEQLDFEGLRRALEAMALDPLSFPPLDIQSPEWIKLPDNVAAVGFTQTGGFQMQNAFWSKRKVEGEFQFLGQSICRFCICTLALIASILCFCRSISVLFEDAHV
jgi:hypothetical protein